MRQLFGGCLLAVGILIAGVSGLCSIGLLMNGIVVDPLGVLGAILFYGGIPFAIGLGLAIAGRRIIRSARDEDYGAGRE
jgi:hypothetical protein